MNCHSQIYANSPYLEPVRESWRTGKPIEWTRVHDLPDFVYFDHSIHVNKGVGCSTCHGRVDLMPLVYQVGSLQMEWCLECHRAPEKVLRPKDQVFNMAWEPGPDQPAQGEQLKREYGIPSTGHLTSCNTCHR
jgi:cytochrome c peroxidase